MDVRSFPEVTMTIDHIAVWVADLEAAKDFYVQYFGANPGARYENPRAKFSSYFLAFAGGARLELMHAPHVPPVHGKPEAPCLGIAHFALAVGTKQGVDALTERLRADGHRVVDGPRTTGDGYDESVVLDPEGNRVEITI